MKLTDFLNDAFQSYEKRRGGLRNCDNIDDFLYREDECLRLMYHYLDIGSITKLRDINFVNLYRVQHIWITFLMGLGIAKHYSLLDNVNVINGMPDDYLWMLTSILHDYGYLKKEVSEWPDLVDVDNYNLLEDRSVVKQLQITDSYSVNYPQFLTYPYSTIKAYYDYSKERIKSNIGEGKYSKDGETVDHGIYGACKAYSEYCDFYKTYEYPRYCFSSDDDANEIRNMGYERWRINTSPEVLRLAKTEPLLYKTACLIAAQHNMFRSITYDTDLKYIKYGLHGLLSTDPVVISKDNPLLFLLSIVDTIECTKRFRNMSLPNVMYSKFGLNVRDVLDNVYIDLDDDGLTIDYSHIQALIGRYRPLFNKAKKRLEMYNNLAAQIQNVATLSNWVKCSSNKTGQLIVRIEF